MTQPKSRERSARAAALWLLVIGLVVSSLTALAPASFLQQRLRFGCVYTEREWVCDDQMALLVPAIVGVALAVLALGGTALVVRSTWDRVRLHAERFGLIALLAVLPTLIPAALLLVDAIAHDAGGMPLEGSRVAMWVERAMLSTLGVAGAGALAGGALRMRARGRSRRVTFVQLIGALLLLLLSAAMSSLATLPAGIVAASVIGAGWYLTVGAWPATKKQVRADVDPGP